MPSRTMRPARAGVSPTSERHSVVFPTPFRAEDGCHGSLVYMHGHALQYVAVAVVGVELDHVQHRSSSDSQGTQGPSVPSADRPAGTSSNRPYSIPDSFPARGDSR